MRRFPPPFTGCHSDSDVFRTFDFTEAAEVDKYYPQYYHKMDKVSHPFIRNSGVGFMASSPRKDDPCTLNVSDS